MNLFLVTDGTLSYVLWFIGFFSGGTGFPSLVCTWKCFTNPTTFQVSATKLPGSPSSSTTHPTLFGIRYHWYKNKIKDKVVEFDEKNGKYIPKDHIEWNETCKQGDFKGNLLFRWLISKFKFFNFECPSSNVFPKQALTNPSQNLQVSSCHICKHHHTASKQQH